MKKAIFDVKTGKQEIVNLTEEEQSEVLDNRAEAQAQFEKAEAELFAAEAEKRASLESAKAKLAALGLDEAEVNAILGL